MILNQALVSGELNLFIQINVQKLLWNYAWYTHIQTHYIKSSTLNTLKYLPQSTGTT